MGRRSINTTKSGKYMNPTDQARKEARKQELKKNKKQRQMVRAAVLKGKDPQQILEEMEKIDQMEYNVDQPSPLNEKVLKDKRKKLRDTLDRVLSMHYKDDPDKWADLRRRQTEYEHRRNQLIAFFESVRSAQQVQIDEIPLPQLPQSLPPPAGAPPALPLAERKHEHTIYSIATALKLQALGQPVKEPPGCPPGVPPLIGDDGEVLDRAPGERRPEPAAADEEAAKPTSLQQKMVALSGQNVDEFMKEIETVQQARPRADEALAPPGTDLPPALAFGALRLPPGPPPGRPLMPPGPPPRMPPPPLRLPPRMLRLPGPPPALSLPTPVLSAAPQLINRAEAGAKQGATISAKPQIRNLSADVTRFVPSTLRIKREDKGKKQSTRALVHELKQREFMQFNQAKQAGQTQGATKDDAYKQFMQEMQTFM